MTERTESEQPVLLVSNPREAYDMPRMTLFRVDWAYGGFASWVPVYAQDEASAKRKVARLIERAARAPHVVKDSTRLVHWVRHLADLQRMNADDRARDRRRARVAAERKAAS